MNVELLTEQPVYMPEIFTLVSALCLDGAYSFSIYLQTWVICRKILVFSPIVVSELVGLPYIKTIGVHLNMPRSLDYLKGSFSGNPSLHDGRAKAKQIFDPIQSPETESSGFGWRCGMRATPWIPN